MIRRGIGVQSFVSAGVPTDADAQAFITAAGITDATQQSAINTLVTDLKGYGIWSKMKAIWPFVGGTSSSHKWNLKDPRDLDAAYRIVWNGGVTHSSNGVQGNGSNGYGDTKFTFNSSNQQSSHLSFYCRTNSQSLTVEFGGSATASTEAFIITRTSSNTVLNSQCNLSANRLSPSNNNSQGFFTNSRTSWSLWKTYKNGTSLAQNTATESYQSNVNIALFRREGVGDLYSSKQCAFASIGDGLSDTEAANLYTAVQAYQTTLSRNV